MPRPNLVEGQLLCNLGEQILHVLGSLGRCLEEEKPSLLCIGCGIGRLNRTLIGLLLDEIQLVTGKGDNDILVCLALKFLDPRLGLVQRCLEESLRQLTLASQSQGPERPHTACVIS